MIFAERRTAHGVNEMPNVWCYSRESGCDQRYIHDAAWLKIDIQELRNINAGNRIIAKNDGYSWGKAKTRGTIKKGSCIDLAENFEKSLFKKIPFRRMARDMAAGDILVVYSVCRIATSVMQLLWTMKSLKERGIRLIVRRQHIDTDDACWATAHHHSPCVLNMKGAFKGVDAMARRKYAAAVQGRFYAPPFYRAFGDSKQRRTIVLDKFQIATFRLIRLYQRSGLSIIQSLIKLEGVLAKRDSRPPIPLNGIAKLNGPTSHYSMGQQGLYFPLWTHSRHKNALPIYGKIRKLWASHSRAVRRRLLL